MLYDAAVWDRFNMAGKQLSYNNIVCFHPSNLFAWCPVWRPYKSWLDVIEKHLGRCNFVLFSKPFLCFGEHCVVSKIIFMPLSRCKLTHKLYSVSFSYYFRFLLCVQIAHEILSLKFSIIDCFLWWPRQRIGVKSSQDWCGFLSKYFNLFIYPIILKKARIWMTKLIILSSHSNW